MKEPRKRIEGESTPPAVEAPALPEPLGTIISEAITEGATDIHMDPVNNELVIRYRVDGIVREKETLSGAAASRILNQVRVAARLEIEKVFTPLESQISVGEGDRRRDIRVTIVPVGGREAIHMRILTLPEEARDIRVLGFNDHDQERIRRALKSPHGLILVGGPTGAGKTTTLYSLLSLLDLHSSIACSIEDPIEFNMPFLRQLEVNERYGITMYQGLRTILRMDPNIILVGEIRDPESAKTAVHAAAAGHLVFATIHAHDAASAISALGRLDIPDFLIGDAVKLVIAQNLVRRLCRDCSRPRPLFPDERKLFETFGVPVPNEVHQAAECKTCNYYGYRGRLGVFEVAGIDDNTARVIAEGAEAQKIRQIFRDAGVQTLVADALQKVARGITSMEEVLRLYWPIETPAGETEPKYGPAVALLESAAGGVEPKPEK